MAICIAPFVSFVNASPTGFVLTADDVNTVSNTLSAFEGGGISLDEITVNRDEEWGRKLLTYYVVHTNAITTKMKLPISRCFAGFGKYPEAAALAQDYVNVYSNDWHGWRILAGADFFMKEFNGALIAYTNAVLFGDDNSYPALGLTALKVDRLDVISNTLPRLLALKSSKATNRNQALQLATVMIAYSLRTNQKDVFIKAVEGFDPKDILTHDDVAFLVKQGCNEFKGKDIDSIQQALGTATRDKPNSTTTNAPSP